MIKKSRVTVAAALMFAIAAVGFCLPGTCTAEGKKVKKSTVQAKATAFVQKAGLYRSVCKSGRSLLGLCGKARSEKLHFTGFKVLKSKHGKAANKIFELVKLFIDDMKIAEFGNWKFKVSIDIE